MLSSNVTEIIFYNLSQHTRSREEKRKLRTRRGFAFRLNRKGAKLDPGCWQRRVLYLCKASSWILDGDAVFRKMQYSLWSKQICKSGKYRIIVCGRLHSAKNVLKYLTTDAPDYISVLYFLVTIKVFNSVDIETGILIWVGTIYQTSPSFSFCCLWFSRAAVWKSIRSQIWLFDPTLDTFLLSQSKAS